LGYINIFSDDIRVYKYAINQIPDRIKAVQPSYVRNDTIEHAIVVINKLFQRANKNVYIKTKFLNPNIFLDDNIIKTLKEIKNNNIMVYFLIEPINKKYFLIQNKILDKFKTIIGKNNININYINNKKQENINDFIVIDEHDFRYELENNFLSCMDKNLQNILPATACFNAHKNKEKNRCLKLLEIFKYLSS